LPYFIPFPFSPFGTMGAFINMKEPPKNRRILLDIGLAGPLAGMIIAIPVLLLGLSLSNLDRLPAILPPGQMWQLEGNSLLYLLGKFLIFKQWLPLPTSYGNLPPLLYWVRYFFTGRPIPFGGTDVILHPVAWAAWAGFLVTSLNLIPAGQLDGGHMLYVLVGRKWAERILPFVLVAVIVLGFFWNGWWLWAVLIFFLGRTYAEPLDQITTLDPTRRWLAILALILFILVFTPVPLNIIG
jgi:membrane-associated protease RseP (regulator of RpoE activity)